METSHGDAMSIIDETHTLEINDITTANPVKKLLAGSMLKSITIMFGGIAITDCPHDYSITSIIPDNDDVIDNGRGFNVLHVDSGIDDGTHVHTHEENVG